MKLTLVTVVFLSMLALFAISTVESIRADEAKISANRRFEQMARDLDMKATAGPPVAS